MLSKNPLMLTFISTIEPSALTEEFGGNKAVKQTLRNYQQTISVSTKQYKLA